ncbi:MAG: hypothetical protein ACYDCL_12565 [Myxococcales bacterium]
MPDAAAIPAAIDAGPRPLPDATLEALWDGGALDLTAAPDASLPEGALLRFVTSAALDDCRLRVLDDQDRMQPNHALLSHPDGGTVAWLQPTRPWPSRQCCRFAVDGERGPLPADAAGQLYQPFLRRFSVLPSAAPARAVRRRHRRFRRQAR